MKSENINIELEVEKTASGEIVKIFDLIKVISKGLDKFQRDFNSELDITPAQFSLLSIMKENQSYSPSALAKLHRSTRPTITGILDSLENKNLVHRDLNKKDRRRFNIYLSKDGQILKKKIPGMEDLFQSCCGDLTVEETLLLYDLLQKLNSTLQSSCLQVAKK
jgi:DNA-binding MarR family transcriptional regulator